MEKMGIRCMVLFLSLAAALLPGVSAGNGRRLQLEGSRDRLAVGGPLRRTKHVDNPERGDVPGWVMITLMSAVLVAALLALAGPALEAMFNQAMDKVGS
ncbi:hypothetical protein [Pseudarthrobacter sp. W1I19]|uniref:hypothetical protein n=1 Tax=Pseudarthrobacter sp. W1I19 TaxID=3042288 RepID=UPI0035937533